MSKDQILEALRTAAKLQRQETSRLQKDFGIDDSRMREAIIPWWIRRLDVKLISPTWEDLEIALTEPTETPSKLENQSPEPAPKDIGRI